LWPFERAGSLGGAMNSKLGRVHPSKLLIKPGDPFRILARNLRWCASQA
jgi:hypothetical protein